MKRITLIVLFSVFAMSASFAQSFDIRAYGGTNVLQLTTDNGTSIIDGVLHHKTVSGRTGYQLGAAVTFGERFFVQPGLEWATLSTKIINKNNVTGNELTDETTLSVFSIPLKIGFRLIDPEKENLINVRIFGGLDGHHVQSVNHKTKSGAYDNITKDDYTNIILNADFGMGIDIFIFYIDLGYQLGISPVHSSGDLSKANSFYANFGLKLSF
jgi:opacity protein-like surface antigen